MIRWGTVRYRAVAMWSASGLVLLTATLLWLFPQWRIALASMLFGGDREASAEAENQTNRQARFTNLDGEVRVRKANQVEWASASLSMGLDKGDLIQTTRNGVARIAFADGTLYVVNPNTLIVIEENAIPNERTGSNVAVQVTSGAVDLSTTRLAGQSRVLFANAEASLQNQSRAQVTNDPDANLHQITISKGEASLRRGGEQMRLTQYDQATFAGPGSPMTRTKITAPPILLTPANMAPVAFAGSEPADVQFAWAPVPSVDSYRIRVSPSPLFTNLTYDRRVRGASIQLPSFKEGDYYWTVTSIGAGGQESQQSEPNQFSVIRQEGGGELLLAVEKLIQHGKVFEIIGRTEPGATVLVNNEPVFSVAPNGSFKHFTSPFQDTGPNRITITAQTREGKVATLRKTIVIQ